MLTPAGLAWLTAAVDPWHDTAITGMHGMPDQGVGNSITFQVIQEYQISKNNSPVTLPAGNWAVRIGNFPTLIKQVMITGNFMGEVVTQDANIAANQRVMIPVQVNYAQDGVDFADLGVNDINPQGCSLPTEYTAGILKVCGMGIEVINTTAQLNLQGMMSCARMTQPTTESYVSYVGLTTPPLAWATKALTPIRSLPKNLAELALYPGFSQDLAKNGYYAPVVLRFGRYGDYPVPLSSLVLTEDPTAGLFNIANPIPCYSPTMSVQAFPGFTNFYTNQDIPIYYDCNSNVVMFTGLSDETTLNLRVRWILERFPNDSEKQILVIAQPSADYDPVALEVYSRVVQRLPAGVPFTENPAGEWWLKMLQSIGEVVSPLLGQLGSPITKALSAAIPVASRALGATFADEKAAQKLVREQKAIENARRGEKRQVKKIANAGVAPRSQVIQEIQGNLGKQLSRNQRRKINKAVKSGQVVIRG